MSVQHALLLFFLSLLSIGNAQSWVSKEKIDLAGFSQDEYPYIEKLDCFAVTYWSDSILIEGLLMEPRDSDHCPAIIFNRGGNRDFAELSIEMLIGVLGKVASEGYVVTASNYRYEDQFGGDDLHDVIHLLAITKRLANVDSTRIGMLGWSRGAMMTCLAMKAKSGMKTAVLVSGAPDLFSTIRERPGLESAVFSKLIPDYFEKKTEVLMARSPYYWADQLDRNTALLILNGKNDKHVDYHQAIRFSQRLDSLHFPHDFQLLETDHSFSNKRRELDATLVDWFDRTLKNTPMRVAITIDDVPNTRNFQLNGFQSKLMLELDRVDIPVTIFVNEGLIYQGDSVQNKRLLEEWVSRPEVTLANHTYAHSRYSEVGLEQFSADVLLGERLSRGLSQKYRKELKYFRFPYNDLGKDSIQHIEIMRFLQEQNYISTPFTIESSDWMFNAVYEYYLNRGDTLMMKKIGEMYITETVKHFAFFDSLTVSNYNRKVNHIYLCHDNRLNEDYFSALVTRLKQSNCEFISLQTALLDEIYQQEDAYWKKWGISWCYRWMIPEDRKKAMLHEPALGGIEEIYQHLNPIFERE